MLRLAAVLVLVFCASVPVLAAGHGADVFKAQGCRACHQLGGIGGAIGPSLAGVGKRMDQQRLRQQIVAHQRAKPSSSMPAYGHLPAADLQALIDYLQGLK